MHISCQIYPDDFCAMSCIVNNSVAYSQQQREKYSVRISTFKIYFQRESAPTSVSILARGTGTVYLNGALT